jgi:hypothetical protein
MTSILIYSKIKGLPSVHAWTLTTGADFARVKSARGLRAVTGHPRKIAAHRPTPWQRLLWPLLALASSIR